ncbi:MAG: channel protein TolC [Alteromonadaceae bacterium]|nr:channel protein TolC [Alteromonadaceae bacterium]
MLIRILAVGLAAGFSLGGALVSAAPVSLSEVVKQAIDTNPDVQAAWREFLEAEQNVKIARSGYLPKVDVTASSSLVRRNYGLDQSYVSNEARISVTQMLYDGFFTSSEVKRLESAKKVRFLELLNQVEQISLEVATAYSDVLLYRELLLVAEDNLKTHVDVYKQIEKSAAAGVARRADLEQISGRLYLAESNVMTEQSNLHDVSSRFLRLTGFRPPAELEPVDNLINAEIPLSMEESLLEAYKRNPGFLAAWYNVNSTNYGIDSAKSRYHPTLNLVGSYGSQSRDDAGLDNTQTEGQIGLQFSYNLYNGGADRASIRAALAVTDQAKDLRDKSCRDVRQTVQIAYNDIRNLDRQIPALNEHRLSSSRVRTAYLDQFKIGDRTLLDLLDSENEAYESGRAYTEAVFTQYKAILRLMAGGGELAEYLTVTRDEFDVTEAIRLSEAVYDPMYVCPAETIDVMSQETNILIRDTDGDGITDLWDECPDTPFDTAVDDFGCATQQQNTGDIIGVKHQSEVVIPFGADSAELDPKYLVKLEPMLDTLGKDPAAGVVVYGHASLEGESHYNMMLSVRRANAVADWLKVQSGSNEQRISAIGLGEDKPLINDISPEANLANRRVEAVVVVLNSSIDSPEYIN